MEKRVERKKSKETNGRKKGKEGRKRDGDWSFLGPAAKSLK